MHKPCGKTKFSFFTFHFFIENRYTKSSKNTIILMIYFNISFLAIALNITSIPNPCIDDYIVYLPVIVRSSTRLRLKLACKCIFIENPLYLSNYDNCISLLLSGTFEFIRIIFFPIVYIASMNIATTTIPTIHTTISNGTGIFFSFVTFI